MKHKNQLNYCCGYGLSIYLEIKKEKHHETLLNQGDTMTFNVPNELSFETNYNFPVYNSTGESEVGNAEVKAAENTVTTTFNNYFAEHPLDKSITLNLNTRINREVVQPDTKHEISFHYCWGYCWKPCSWIGYIC